EDRRHARAEQIEFESSLVAIQPVRVLRTPWRRNMVVRAAMLIECDDEQGVIPLPAVAHGLVHVAQELLTRSYHGIRVIVVPCRVPIRPIRLEVSEGW